jgi:metal-dependent amidase/aminoacylase/carboxypeptidase family protein
VLLAAVCGLLAPAMAAAQEEATAQQADLLSRFVDRVEGLREELIGVRRDIHRHPEISGQEERTAGIVAERLRAAGFEVRTGIGGHGVVGLLRGAGVGPLLAFRADMDAVRSNAPDPVEFDSETEGVPGEVMLIFQPAEESARGARAMLADGAFADPVPDAVFAYHTTPFEVGQIATASRTLMPGRDAVRVEIRGEGDLELVAQTVREAVIGTGTVAPEEATSPVGGEFVLVQGARAARDAATGGWLVRATLTTSSRDMSGGARRAIEGRLAELERPGLTLDLDYRERFIAGVTNNSDLVEAANATARAVLGDEAVLMLETMSPLFSEDFGSFQEEVPGVMYFLGVSNSEEGWVGMPHSPDYVADEEAIFVGARTMAAVFFDLFRSGLPGGARETAKQVCPCPSAWDRPSFGERRSARDERDDPNGPAATALDLHRQGYHKAAGLGERTEVRDVLESRYVRAVEHLVGLEVGGLPVVDAGGVDSDDADGSVLHEPAGRIRV